MSGLENTEIIDMDTPFGKPSAPITIGTLEGMRVAFLARHGIGHHIAPTKVPTRETLCIEITGRRTRHQRECLWIITRRLCPWHIVIPDDIFDYTKDRVQSFFGERACCTYQRHCPFCNDLSQQLETAVRATGATVHHGGHITIEGPRFSTKAESQTYRSWGMSLIGMTASPEAFLAREAELCYATMAHVTDYDVWHESESPVTVEMVIQTLNKNTDIAQKAIRNLVRDLNKERACNCGQALATALITNPEVVPAKTRKKLDLLIGKYFK